MSDVPMTLLILPFGRGGGGPNPAVLAGAAVAILAALYVGLNVAL